MAAPPLVSVIMPVRNEAAYILRNLEALLEQDYPLDRVEVLVADGMSDDGTREIVQRFMERGAAGSDAAARPGFELQLIDNPGRIMPAGANAALRRARGEVCMLLGGHAAFPPDYIRRCVETLQRSEADCVGGAVDSAGNGYVGRAIAAAMSSPFGIGGSGFRTASPDGAPVVADTVPFGAYRRSVFERVGLFNEAMVRHQDYEFNYRVRRSGGRILLLPTERVVYWVRPTLGRLWRQYWQYGVWKGRFLRTHPDSLRPRHLIPSLMVVALLAGVVAALAAPSGAAALALVASAYLAFVLVALLTFAARGQAALVPVLPAVLACLHFSYGLGVLAGLAHPPIPPAPRL